MSEDNVSRIQQEAWDGVMRRQVELSDQVKELTSRYATLDAAYHELMKRAATQEQMLGAGPAGYAAGAEGKPLSANPYHPERIDEYTAWQRGWRLAYLERKTASLHQVVQNYAEQHAILTHEDHPNDECACYACVAARDSIYGLPEINELLGDALKWRRKQRKKKEPPKHIGPRLKTPEEVYDGRDNREA